MNAPCATFNIVLLVEQPSTWLWDNEETNLTGPIAARQEKQIHLVHQLLRLMCKSLLQHGILLCCTKLLCLLYVCCGRLTYSMQLSAFLRSNICAGSNDEGELTQCRRLEAESHNWPEVISG